MTNSNAGDIKIPPQLYPKEPSHSWDGKMVSMPTEKPGDFKVNTDDVSKSAVISIHLAPGGGYAARLVKK